MFNAAGFVILALLVSIALPADAVVNGRPARSRQFPSSIAIQMSFDGRLNSNCTAAQIAPRVFLTAAHCFDTYFDSLAQARDFKVAFVQHEVATPAPLVSGVNRRLVGRPLIHPRYKRGARGWSLFGNPLENPFKNPALESIDLAVFKVDADVPGLQNALLASFPVTTADHVLIGGYGMNSMKMTCLRELSCRDEPIECADGLPCVLSMAVQPVNVVFDETLILRQSSARPAHLLFGDSGGPAYMYRNNRLFVVGINQIGKYLDDPSAVKESWLVRIDRNLRWIHAAQARLQSPR